MIVIEDKILKAFNLTEKEFMEELALFLYKNGKYSIGQVASLIGLNHYEFQALLNRNNFAVNYDLDDLQDDINTIEKLNSQDGNSK